MKSKCRSCKYWDQIDLYDKQLRHLGKCRAKSPNIFWVFEKRHMGAAATPSHFSTEWPIVQEDDWCGEYSG